MTVTEHSHHDGCEHDDPAPWAGRLPAWTPPVLVGLLGVAACVVLNVRDPNVSGSYGFCPSRAIFGIDCPGCGLMRGTHALTDGDIATALDHNILILPVLGLILYAYVRWAATYFGRELPAVRPPNWLVWTTAGLVMAFAVVRNLGGSFEYLASTAT